MSDSTALAVPGVSSEELEKLQAQQAEEFDSNDFQTPILKIGQPLTREVQDELAEPGSFINTLTQDDLGNKIEFIVAYYQKGWFAADRDSGKAYVAFGSDIPDGWAEFVGEEFVGTPFAEYPDAEPQFKEAVNRKEREWGKGPPVSTTHNYTGLVIVSPIEGSDDEPELQPVRLSLQRTGMKAVRKINSLKQMKLRNRAFWDVVWNFETKREQFNQGSAYLLVPSIGRDTTAEEKQLAAELAIAVSAGRVSSNDAGEVEAPAEPAAHGGADL